MTYADLQSIDKDNAPEAAKRICAKDIGQLVEWLSESEDKIRYPSLLILQSRSETHGDVYPYRETFREKLKSDNSFQRNIGLILLAGNAKWDDGWLDVIIGEYLDRLTDDKPITVRMCVQHLKSIVPYKPGLCGIIAERLMSLDLNQVRETMRKLVLIDILEVLAMIRKTGTSDEIESFIMDAMEDGLLGSKAKKQVGELLKT